MRAFTGWRFLLAIAMPLTLASLGAINLSYDLLNRVASAGDDAEHSRNRQVLEEALREANEQLGRLTLQNAQWNEAAVQTKDKIDPKWFADTWGSLDGVRQGYDMIAVLDSDGQVVAGKAKGRGLDQNSVSADGPATVSLSDLVPKSWLGRQVVSGFANTPYGPAIVAFAPIVEPASNNRANGRILFMGHQLSRDALSNMERQLLVGGLVLSGNIAKSEDVLQLPAVEGQSIMALRWQDRNFGGMVTNAAWTKASAVLAFLILVMTGIGVVCWRLVQNLVANEERATHDSLHDHLTGMPNRQALLVKMREVRESAKQPYALAFADLDGFKEVNDSYGHHIGDRLICMVAAGVTTLASHAALSTRMGGDEFVVLFSGSDCVAQAEAFSVQLIRLLAQPFDMDGRLASVGASIGVAGNAGEHEDSEVLRRADVAMYKAKADGKNRHRMYDVALDKEREENLSIANELKDIIRVKDLDVVYQPVINAKTLLISGVEALVRWPKSSSRQVGAERFVTIAESSGLIDELGALVLNKACEAARAWPQLRLAVNISAVQLNNPHFVRNALDVLHSHGIPTNRVEFEITETSLIHDTDRAKEVFKTLQMAGVKIALDDFGSGFSSIGYLRTFNFDRIKIDKSIVSKVLSSPSELAVLQGALLVARGLSAEVTAEGVEIDEEVPVLRLAGVTELQGYYFHKPMAAKDITQLLNKFHPAETMRTQIVA
jgi:diguanylate cyclase (GGDEF)-like protein